MKLQSIYVTNFLGVQHAQVDTSAAVQLFAGPNGAGKSSLRDAIALALTADLGRVSLKKEAGQLVHDGADAAVCQVVTADGDTYQVSLTTGGRITDSMKGRESDPLLSYVLDAQRFARLDATARRAFLYELMAVKTDQGDIAQRLEAKGCHIGKVHRVLPLLRAGFDAACKEAKAKATEAKGAWRVITGETYGSEKAKAWTATVPPYDSAAATENGRKLEHCDVAIGQWQQQVGSLQAEQQHRAKLAARRDQLGDPEEKVRRVQKKTEVDKTELADVEKRLQVARAAAGVAQRVGLVHELAWAVDNLIFFGDGPLGDDPNDQRIKAALAAYEAEHGKVHRGLDGQAAGDPEARAQLPGLEQALATCQRAVANDERDIAAAQAEVADLLAINAELAEPFDQAAMAEARAHIEQLQTERAALVKASDTFRSVKALVDSAERKTKEAAEHAADVADWDLIGDALSPNGIPAEILAAALGPINERLAQSAADAAWAQVTIGEDMAILAAGRDYRLLSESEKWRTDAMLAEAIANLSGLRLLVLDRFDVLDLPGRSDLFAWLDVLAENVEIDTAIVFGTLKAAPASLPPSIDVHWIENGLVAQPLKAAA